MAPSHIARDISYASSARTRGGRAVIRLVENATGRIDLIRRAEGYDRDVAAGRCFWQVLTDRYGLKLELAGGSLENIPAEGPLVVVANHPYGILDGLMMGRILSERRGDFRILANSVFRRAEALERVILPISFDDTRAAVQLNIETRAAAVAHLQSGGAMAVFPGGTVSTAIRPFGRPMDPGWRSFTARMVARSGATVVPVFFAGHNSRLFQLASHLHQTLRLALLLKEFRARVDHPVRVVIGAPIPASDLHRFGPDAKAMMDFLRRRTYELSPEPCGHCYGFDFDAKGKG
ncbi:lysophospholipid acyltransferase family protein [Plastorhodobacter daqingensis]|uniref:Lysophospholipid acyltransferase family protein n=1 Tax=Plastorhodobacter daqingensis TaxID=1387281 RepID=A0ABW2UFR2_9RHOB